MSEKFVCVVYSKKWLAQSKGTLNINNFYQAEVFCNCFVSKSCLIFSFFNDCFLLFILVSVAPNHKTVTESDLLNNIAGVLKYAHEKIGDGVVER